MSRVLNLYQSSVGKKILMALSGVVLYGFVVAHMIGNLKVYQGQPKFDAYAHFLREVGYPALGHGQLLWIARIVLLGCVALHIAMAAQLTRRSHQARRVRYRRDNSLSFSYASKTMRWGGVLLVGFIVYHLLHLTLGSVHPDFDHDSPYRNLITGFSIWPVALAYMLCMVPLGLHMYHGLWSMTQTLSIDDARVLRARRPVAAVIALAVTLGNISIPLSVLAGVVR